MMLMLSFGAMAFVAMAFLLFPLLRRASETSGRDEAAIAVLRDQFAEIEQDEVRGLISASEARDAGIEIKRRLLALGKIHEGAMAQTGRGGWLLGAAMVIVGASGVGLYAMLGQPGVPSVPYAERADERAASTEIAGLAAELRTRLEADANGGPFEGWVLLGQTYMRMNAYDGAAEAFTVAADRPDANSATLSQLAEALIAAENGVVTSAAETAIEAAIDLDPLNPAAVYYHAVALDQTGRTAVAYDVLAARIAQEAEVMPWMEAYIGQLNRIGERLGRQPVGPMMLLSRSSDAPGPNADDIAAAAELSAENRAAMVQSMVVRLAARLQEESEDLEGWLRLANAYRVLGDIDAARDALTRAEPLLPDTGPERQTYQDLSRELAP
jgi:cytochrome c-type biogenesis protein CcmH